MAIYQSWIEPKETKQLYNCVDRQSCLMWHFHHWVIQCSIVSNGKMWPQLISDLPVVAKQHSLDFWCAFSKPISCFSIIFQIKNQGLNLFKNFHLQYLASNYKTFPNNLIINPNVSEIRIFFSWNKTSSNRVCIKS